MSRVSDASPGLFGKMPMLGDFVSRRVSASFVDPWDDWLRRGMAHSCEVLGPDWLRLYLAGPLWRFALRPGVVTDEALAGVLMPSVDAVNRHFPLTVVAVAPCGYGPFALAAETDPWFVAAERLALSCLEPGATVSSVELGLETLGPLPAPAASGARGGGPPGALGQRWQLASDLPESLHGVYPHILDDAAVAAYGVFSLWWTAGSDEVEPVVLLFPGLPAADAFPSLLQDERPEAPVANDASP